MGSPHLPRELTKPARLKIKVCGRLGTGNIPLTLSDSGLLRLGRVLAQDGGDFTWHEGPRGVGGGQRAFLAARTIDLQRKQRSHKRWAFVEMTKSLN